VASLFALFTVLSLAQRIVEKIPANNSPSNLAILGLSIISYALIWVFGLYSLGNFTYYSTVAQIAEKKIVGDMDHRLVSEYKGNWTKVFRMFVNFKLNKNQGRFMSWIRSNNEQVSIIIYILIGVLPFIAFLFWVFSS
jgi:hypothetical protein